MRRLRGAWFVLVPVALLGATPAWGQEPERVIGGGGVGLAVYEGGNPSGPPILFLHGFIGSHLSWANQFSGPLAESFRLVTLDLRGHGASEKPLESEAYTSPAMWAEDIAAVIRAKDLDRPVLVGHSHGGLVISDYIRTRGDAELGGVVFVGSLPAFGTDEALDFVGEEAVAAMAGLLAADVATSIAATRGFLPLVTARPMDREAYETGLAAAMMVPPQVRAGMFDRSLDDRDVLATVSVPAMIVQGQADRIVLPHTADVLAEALPEARLLRFDAVGHAPHLEDPDRFNRELEAFVRSIDR